jgi:hypothetical protein
MVVCRCTRKLLARLNQDAREPEIESTTRLGDWYGNILQIGRRQYLLFISERSRLPVVLPIREAGRLVTVFSDAVGEVLAAIGVPAPDIADERAHMLDVRFGRTRNRSLLGTMNDFAFMVQPMSPSRRAEPETLDELMRFLARTPILSLNGARPIDMTLAAFGVRTTSPAWD